jgi:subtilisin
LRSPRPMLAVLVSTFLLAVGLSVPQIASASASDVVPGTFIVDLEPGTSPARYARSIAEQYGGSARFVYDHVFGGFSFRGSAEEAARLADDPRVRSVDADRIVRLTDSPQTSLDHLNTDRVGGAYDAGFRGINARIAILDTGVQASHPVFADHDNVRSGKDCGGNGGSTADSNGHGTASASNAAGRIGVAHSAKIIPVKVFSGSSGVTGWETVICGLNWVDAYNDNHSDDNDIHVVSLSLAGAGIPALKDAVARVVNDGIVVVAAAGNNDTSSPESPANYPDVIAATALASGTNFASFSAHRGHLAAPGVNIYSADDGSDYERRTGTSRSAPQIAGAAAIAISENLALGPGEVRNLLRRSGKCPNGKNSGALTCSGKGSWSGDGDGTTEPRIDAYCAGYYAKNGVLDPSKCKLV